MDINSQINNVVAKHSAACAAEVTSVIKSAAAGLFEGAPVVAVPPPAAATPAKAVAKKSAKKAAKKVVKKIAGAVAAAKGQKRPAAELAQIGEKLLAHVKAHPGQRIEAIGAALSLTTKILTLPMKKLIKSSEVATRGEKRATEYFPGKAG